VARQEALIDSEVSKYRRSVFSLNTQLTYQSQLRVYLRFCLFFGYLAVPATTQTLVRYCVFLARNHTANSVRQYLNIVRIIHLSQGLPNPLEKNFALHSILKGIDRVRGQVPKQKLPITPQLLRMFYDKLDFSCKLDITFYATCVVGFFTFFRKSTLLSPSLAKHDYKIHLCRGDVSFSNEGICITVRHSKTIQCHERVIRVPLLPSPGKLCPVRALCKMWSLAPNLPQTAPLFSFIERGRVRCLEYHVFVDRLRQLVALCGLNPEDYSGHSLRRGGCTWAWQHGASPQIIMSQGDWRSCSWLRYVYVDFSSRVQVARLMSDSVGNLG